MSETRMEWRLVWKRVGLPERRRIFRRGGAAEKRILLMGPEPWLALGKNPGHVFCCDGYGCACGGVTWRERLMEDRGGTPELEYAYIEERTVTRGPWERRMKGESDHE